MGNLGPGVFENDRALNFAGRLRKAAPEAVGDLISAAIRLVAQAESPLEPGQVQDALAAVALLLSEFDPEVLAGGDEGTELAGWFADLDIELNPARRLLATGALNRILLPQDNEWFDSWSESGSLEAAVATVEHLRDLLADSAAQQ